MDINQLLLIIKYAQRFYNPTILRQIIYFATYFECKYYNSHAQYYDSLPIFSLKSKILFKYSHNERIESSTKVQIDRQHTLLVGTSLYEAVEFEKSAYITFIMGHPSEDANTLEMYLLSDRPSHRGRYTRGR